MTGDVRRMALPEQTPLYHAAQSERYERQRLIQEYQNLYQCRLIIMSDAIFDDSVTFFEDLIYDANPKEDLHVLLRSPGGDGEIAVRLVRSAQARCRELTVLIPDIAKSAATLFAIGAHHIMMTPTSDLGPVDPQFLLGDGTIVAAKDIIAAVDEAWERIQTAPNTYPLYASLLDNVDALTVQRARSALGRTEDLLLEALRSNPDRSGEDTRALSESLSKSLITEARYHGALFGMHDARDAGLPVEEAEPTGDQWRRIWLLWAKYFQRGTSTLRTRVYEGERASWVGDLSEVQQR